MAHQTQGEPFSHIPAQDTHSSRRQRTPSYFRYALFRGDREVQHRPTVLALRKGRHSPPLNSRQTFCCVPDLCLCLIFICAISDVSSWFCVFFKCTYVCMMKPQGGFHDQPRGGRRAVHGRVRRRSGRLPRRGGRQHDSRGVRKPGRSVVSWAAECSSELGVSDKARNENTYMRI